MSSLPKNYKYVLVTTLRQSITIPVTLYKMENGKIAETTALIVLQFFFLIVLSYFSSILVVYLLGEVDAFTPILHIFSFAPCPPFVSLTFSRT